MLTFQFNPFPDLHTERLLLRRMVKDDAPILWRLRNTDDVMQYIDRTRQKDMEETEAFIRMVDEMIDGNKDINWVIALKEHPERMLGTIGYYRTQHEHYRGEIGYMLDPAYWRKGIMQEAVKTIVTYGFDSMGFHSISACINPDNEASRQLLLKTGFRKEAYFREDFFYQGKFKDTEVYGLLASEWENAQGISSET